MKIRSFNVVIILALLLSLLGSALTVTPAYATAIVVNTNADNTTSADGFCTLREAINNANNDSDTTSNDCAAGAGADTITFAADYTITLNLGLLGLSSNITINGNGATKTIIQASPCNPVTLPGECTPATDRIFFISSGNVTLNDMTIRHGDCTSCNTGDQYGGGIWNGGTLTINNSSISDNKSVFGGGIYNAGTLTASNMTFNGNNADQGGGMYNQFGATLTLNTSTVSGNFAATSVNSAGAGIYNAGGNLSLQFSNFSGNDAVVSGGGIYNETGSTVNILGGIFSDNLSFGGVGGGIFNEDGVTTELTGSVFSGNVSLLGSGGGIFNGNGSLTISDSTFDNNTAIDGGGVYGGGNTKVFNSTFENNTARWASFLPGSTSPANGGGLHCGCTLVVNSTFYNNKADYGGGIYTTGYTANIINSTFSNNSANDSGGGIYNSALFTNSGTLTLKNTIVANSTAGGNCGMDIPLTADLYNLSTDSSCNNATQKTSLEINLQSPLNNGGTTKTMALGTGSSAIDMGDDTVCDDNPGPNNLDQRGVTRPQGAGCDIGAFELNTFTSTFTSQALQDGRLLESSETSGSSGSMDHTALTFIVGDDNLDRQYRSILHFDTSSLPDNAVITKAVLAIKRQGITGSDPFLSLGLLQVDMRKPDFGAPSLELLDFNAAPAKTNVGSFSSSLSTPWHRAILNNPAKRHINLLGSTQFRLSFTLDDNDNTSADFIRFYSGDSHTGSSPAASRPKLIITYTLP